MEAVFLFGLFILLLMLSVPIGYAIGMVTLVTMLHFTSMPTLMIAQNSIAGVDSFPLLAIPFFMLAGNLMSGGGIAKRLVNFFECFIGHITGGLGMVTIIVCMFFAAISGSAVATVSAVGAFMIPQMVEHGYSKPFSAALTAAAGTIGVIIPPSVPFVIYGVVSGASITSLFTAGFLPGILMGVALMIVCFIVSKKRGYRGSTEPPSASVIWATFKDAVWAILSPVIILGGIYSGKFTPTEAAAVGTVYALFITFVIYRTLSVKDLPGILMETVGTSAMIFAIMIGASLFGFVLTILQVPQALTMMVAEVEVSRWVFFILINLLLLFLGCILETVSIIFITVPILYPIIKQLGFDPIWFNVVMQINMEMALITPPVGMNLFVLKGVSPESRMEDIIRGVIPYIGVMAVEILFLCFVPELATWLPSVVK